RADVMQNGAYVNTLASIIRAKPEIGINGATSRGPQSGCTSRGWCGSDRWEPFAPTGGLIANFLGLITLTKHSPQRRVSLRYGGGHERRIQPRHLSGRDQGPRVA